MFTRTGKTILTGVSASLHDQTYFISTEYKVAL